MKHWRNGFFFIDRRAIPNAMVWRHLDAATDDPRPTAGSFNVADVRRLSAHVVKLRDMPKGVLVLSGLSRVWKSLMGIHDFLCLLEWTGVEVQEEPHLDVRPTLQRLPFYCTPLAAADAVIPELAPEDLVIGTPSSKIVAKAEATQKRKASTSGAASSHVAKCTRSALAQSSGSITRPSLFVGDSDDESDGDDDSCVEIPLVTPLCSADVIPPSGNQGRSSVAPPAEGSNTQDSRGKGIMVDDVVAPSHGVSRPRSSSGPAPSFRDVSDDAIHTDFFPFFTSPYYATYLEDDVAGNLSTLKKQVFGLNDKLATSNSSFSKSKAKRKEWKKKIKSLTKSMDNFHSKVARLSTALNQATTLEAKRDEEILWLKAIKPQRLYVELGDLLEQPFPEQSDSIFPRVLSANVLARALYLASIEEHETVRCLRAVQDIRLLLQNFLLSFGGQFQGLVQKFLASDEFSRVQGELLSLAASAGFERGLSMHQTEDEFADVLKKMVNFMPGARDGLAEASPVVAQTSYAFLNKISKHATEPLSVILQLELEKLAHPANVPTPRDTHAYPPIVKESTMTHVSQSLELSGVSRVLDDVAEVAAVESECVSSGPTDVVVALSVDGKGNVLIPSSVVGEENGRGAWYAEEHLLLRAWGKLTVDVLLSIQQILSLMGCRLLSEADIMLLCPALELAWLLAR
ncbi:hypothetical protein Tco_0973954 [Tanacetum coccineum]|uniref:Uncharacterized protein n=1 Tax=Tanacetum coccineum TaxID=301880 RepID=A0ABQ5EA87_9ASTR